MESQKRNFNFIALNFKEETHYVETENYWDFKYYIRNYKLYNADLWK